MRVEVADSEVAPQPEAEGADGSEEAHIRPFVARRLHATIDSPVAVLLKQKTSCDGNRIVPCHRSFNLKLSSRSS